jgi:hypothetical protein
VLAFSMALIGQQLLSYLEAFGAWAFLPRTPVDRRAGKLADDKGTARARVIGPRTRIHTKRNPQGGFGATACAGASPGFCPTISRTMAFFDGLIPSYDENRLNRIGSRMLERGPVAVIACWSRFIAIWRKGDIRVPAF